MEMQVGEQLTIPVEDYGHTTIRTYASELGFCMERKYRTKRNKKERTYTIIRES